MFAFFITLVVVGLFILCGVLVNIYFYSQGALKVKPIGYARTTDHCREEILPEEHYYMSIGATEDIMGAYIRKGVMVFIGVLLLACTVLTFLFNSVAHSR